MNEVIKNDKTNIDEKYKRFEKIHDKIKFKAFGKVTIRQRRIPKDKLEVVGKDTARELLEAQQKKHRAKLRILRKQRGQSQKSMGDKKESSRGQKDRR